MSRQEGWGRGYSAVSALTSSQNKSSHPPATRDPCRLSMAAGTEPQGPSLPAERSQALGPDPGLDLLWDLSPHPAWRCGHPALARVSRPCGGAGAAEPRTPRPRQGSPWPVPLPAWGSSLPHGHSWCRGYGSWAVWDCGAGQWGLLPPLLGVATGTTFLANCWIAPYIIRIK